MAPTQTKNNVAVIMGDNIGKHCHETKNDQDRNKTAWYKLITVLCMCFCFMIAEIIGGIIAGSIAIQTDAAHMASDIAGYFFSILAIYISGKSKRLLRNLLTLKPFSKKNFFFRTHKKNVFRIFSQRSSRSNKFTLILMANRVLI